LIHFGIFFFLAIEEHIKSLSHYSIVTRHVGSNDSRKDEVDEVSKNSPKDLPSLPKD
jgi:hypothetical protein